MRDLMAAIKAYETKFEVLENTKNEAAIYPGDILQLVEAAEGNAFEAACKGLQAGFMIGFRYAKRQARQAKKKAPVS